MNNSLLLLSKNDIPFVEAQINIHQPTIAEISLIGEDVFHSGCQFLNFSKSLLSEQDRSVLVDKSDFDIFMSIMCGKERLIYKNNVMMVLALLFPQYQINFTPREIILISKDSSTRINGTNFNIFKDIIVSMFGLNEFDSTSGEYNPIDKKAEKIAEKLKNRKKGNSAEDQPKSQGVFIRYVSILAVGEHKDINELMNYTVFQLKDEFKRFLKKQDFDIYMRAKLAGAQDLDEIDNWMDDIHS